MSQRDYAYVLDILDAARLILSFMRGVEREAFEQDLMRQDAVIRRFEIIGEGARRLSATFREAHAEVPWGALIGMRNRLIHEYDAVDLDLVWMVVQNELPLLIAQLEKLLPPSNT